ncbi:MAG: hypothetical protein ABEK42_09150 [Thiohalorhabdaceae bacterium]
MPQAEPPASGPDATPARPDWGRTHLERVLRTLEGRGPSCDQRVRQRTQATMAELRQELPQVIDHLWASLMCAGLPRAARFFRPVAGRGTPVLWLRRGDGGADALHRPRLEALLERRCAPLADDGLDPARIRHQCACQLRNGLPESDLVRILSLTSPARAAILRRLCSSGETRAVSP